MDKREPTEEERVKLQEHLSEEQLEEHLKELEEMNKIRLAQLFDEQAPVTDPL